MKLTVDWKELTEAAKSVARAANPKSTLPILGHMLLVAKDGQLRMSATNLEIGINHYIEAEVKEEGSATVPAKTFTDLLTVSGNGDIANIHSLKDQSVKLKCGTVDSKIKGFDPSDFPPMIDRSEVEGGYLFEVGTLTDLINMTAFAAAIDETRPTLGGVLMRFEKDKLIMAASDGFRLSRLEAPLPLVQDADAPPEKTSVIIPASALKTLTAILGKRKEVKMYLLDRRAVFVSNDVDLFAQSIEGTFPDVEEIIPKVHNVHAEFLAGALEHGCKAASVFAYNGMARLNLSEEGVTMAAQDAETGSNQTEIRPESMEGEEMEIGFNVKLILDFLGSKGGDMVIFESESPVKPGVFKYKGNPDFVHVIMPMHIN